MTLHVFKLFIYTEGNFSRRKTDANDQTESVRLAPEMKWCTTPLWLLVEESQCAATHSPCQQNRVM